VREALAFLLLACACGAALGAGSAPDAKKATSSQTSEDAPGVPPRAERTTNEPDAPGEPGRGFASLEARGPSLAPGMVQAVERESTGDRVELVRSASKDTCLRVAFEAAQPVVVRLLESDGTVLAETRSTATTGVLGDRGPVCIRKGVAVSAVAEGAGHIRWIAWASP
jgi:hypothetical protein